MDPYHPIDHHWSTTTSTTAPPTADGPNTRLRLSQGLPPISGRIAPLPPASYPSPAESPNDEWGCLPSAECAREETNGWEYVEGEVEEEAQWRQGEGPAQVQYAYDPSYAPPPPGSFFALDPSLPLPSPAELESCAYPLRTQSTTTTLYSWDWEASSTAPPSTSRYTYEEHGPSSSEFSTFAQMLPLAGASDVTGLVSREEWLRLGGFGDGGAEEGGEEDEKPRPMPMPSSSRWSRGDVDTRTSFADLPSPHYSFPSPSPVPPSFALEHTSAEPNPSLHPLPQTTKPTRLTSTTRLAAPRPLAPPPPPTSTPSFSLTPLPSLPPSLSNPSKSHARRHSASHIPRPRNAFILFRQHFVSSTPLPLDPSLGLHSHANISQVVGAVWRGMSDEEKRGWEVLAEEEKRLHAEMYPGYQFKPKAKGVRRPVGTGKKALASRARREAEEAARVLEQGDVAEVEEEKGRKKPRRARTASTSATSTSAESTTREARRMELVAQALLEGEEDGAIAGRVEELLALEAQAEEKEEQRPLAPSSRPRPSLQRPATFSHPPAHPHHSITTERMNEFGARYSLPPSASPSTSSFPSPSPSSATFPRPAFRPSRLAKRPSLPPTPSLPSTFTFAASAVTKFALPPQQPQPFHLGGQDLFSAEGTQQAGDLERLFGGRVLRR